MSKLKQTIADNGGFKHWFVNVFWYHYRWIFLAAVVVLGIVTIITIDALRQERYDTTVVLATDYYVEEDDLTALEELFESVTEDYDGNGRVSVNIVSLYCGNTELGRKNEERMYLYMCQEDVSMFLMSEELAIPYTIAELEYFVDPLENYDLPCDEDNPVRLSLKDNPLLTACGLENIYLAIMDHGKTQEEQNAVEAAVAMANALLDTGSGE